MHYVPVALNQVLHLILVAVSLFLWFINLLLLILAGFLVTVLSFLSLVSAGLFLYRLKEAVTVCYCLLHRYSIIS